jgi:hypothetical protein
MNRTIRLGGLLLAATLAGSAQAAPAPAFVSCHGCTAEQARRAAEGAVPSYRPTGDYPVYTVNTPGNELRAFLVIVEWESGRSSATARRMQPEQRYVREFREARDEWLYVRSAISRGIEIPKGFPVDDAEQVIGSDFNQTVISEQINRHVPSRIGSLFGSALILFRQVLSVSLVVDVNFPDGSSALFELVRIDGLTSGHTFVYRYQTGSARDSDGNRIPDSPESLQNFRGTFTTFDNLERFGRRSERYGALWELAWQLSRQRLPATLVCVREVGGRITCWRG